jgi:hypothetical protein
MHFIGCFLVAISLSHAVCAIANFRAAPLAKACDSGAKVALICAAPWGKAL